MDDITHDKHNSIASTLKSLKLRLGAHYVPDNPRLGAGDPEATFAQLDSDDVDILMFGVEIGIALATRSDLHRANLDTLIGEVFGGFDRVHGFRDADELVRHILKMREHR